MKPINCGCGGEARVLHRVEKGYYVICRDCFTRTDFKVTESEAISAWNKAMSGNANVLKSEYKRGYTDGMAKQRHDDEVSRRWEESYKASQMPWNYYTEMGG